MPGHKIPDPYAWNETFRVFYDNLDQEHQGLFEYIFALVNNPNNSAALSKLKDKVDEHFANEEKKMELANYAEFKTHKPKHQEFQNKLKALQTPLTQVQLDYAKEWLVDHIKDTDFKYKTKL